MASSVITVTRPLADKSFTLPPPTGAILEQAAVPVVAEGIIAALDKQLAAGKQHLHIRLLHKTYTEGLNISLARYGGKKVTIEGFMSVFPHTIFQTDVPLELHILCCSFEKLTIAGGFSKVYISRCTGNLLSSTSPSVLEDINFKELNISSDDVVIKSGHFDTMSSIQTQGSSFLVESMRVSVSTGFINNNVKIHRYFYTGTQHVINGMNGGLIEQAIAEKTPSSAFGPDAQNARILSLMQPFGIAAAVRTNLVNFTKYT